MSPLLRLYLGFSQVSGPIWRYFIRKRLKKGKEVPDRVAEKFGEYPVERPEGPVIWFHALSVGESLALVPLIERALSDDPALSIVLTTSTATSVAALDRARLPERAIHILLPVDTAQAVGRFLDHWRPEVAVFAELDFWPRLMHDTHARGIPMILVNSRMSDKSVRTRGRLGGMMRDILGMFDALLIQDEVSAASFRALGAPADRVRVVGPLKSAARPLPADEGLLAEMQSAIGDRSVWLAAATERSEHPAVVAATVRLAERSPELLTIVAPRYVEDGGPLADLFRAEGLSVAMRSAGDAVEGGTQVYIADTIGEMGIWYRVSPVSFIGHSLPPEGVPLGGKNPFEAAALGSAIVHGPALDDFVGTYESLAAVGAARVVADAGELALEVERLMAADARAPMIAAARQVIAEGQGVLDATWQVIREARP